MRKLFNYAIMLATAAMFAVGCNRTAPEPTPTPPQTPTPTPTPAGTVKVSLKAATTSYSITGEDINAAFTIEAEEPLKSDAEFTVTATSTLSHELKTPKLSIKQGAQKAEGQLVISKTALEPGQVVLTVTTDNKDVFLDTKSITIKTQNFTPPPTGYCPVVSLEQCYAYISAYNIGNVSASNIPQDTKYGYRDLSSTVVMLPKGKSEISVTFSQGRTGANDPYYVAFWIDKNGNGDFADEGELIMKEPVAANGEDTFTAILNMPSDAAKSGRIRFGTYFSPDGDRSKTNITDAGCGDIDSGDIMDFTYNLIESEDVPVISLSAENTNIVVNDKDVTSKVTITLSEAAEEEIVLNLIVDGDIENPCQHDASVTIPAGQLAVTTTLTFPVSLYAAESVKSEFSFKAEPVNPLLAEIGPNGVLQFTAKGTGTANIATVAFESADFAASESNNTVKFTVTLASNAETNTTVGYTLTGADERFISSPLTGTVNIAQGQKSAAFDVQLVIDGGFEYEANSRDVKVTITSETDGVIVMPSNNSSTVKIAGTGTNPSKPQLNIATSPEGKSTQVVLLRDQSVTKKLQVYIPKKKNGTEIVPAPDDIYFRVLIGGGGVKEGTHYTLSGDVFVMKKGENQVDIDVNWLPAGFVSGSRNDLMATAVIVDGYATASSYALEYAVFRPAAGQYCTVLPSGTTNEANEWGTLRSWSMGGASDMNAAQFGYNDMTNGSTVARFNKGQNNTVTITVGTDANHSGDKYTVALYIDWNGDGDFDDAGENYSTELFEIGERGGSQVKTFDVIPPANAVASSRIRFGLMLKGMIEEGCVSKFESHKVVDLNYVLVD